MDAYTHLLDTNIVSDLVRRPQGMAASRLALVEPAKVCTSLIVASQRSPDGAALRRNPGCLLNPASPNPASKENADHG